MAKATNLTPNDINAGESWGCRYKVTKMLDHNGNPVKDLQPGDTAAGPGVVEGIGIIKTRDVDKQLLEVQDHKTGEVSIVSFDDVWDIDRVEFKDPE